MMSMAAVMTRKIPEKMRVGQGEDQRRAKGPATVRSHRTGGEDEAGPVRNSFEALVQGWLRYGSEVSVFLLDKENNTTNRALPPPQCQVWGLPKITKQGL